ncbi:MAG: OmpA family protein [Polyangiales bacterium]
MRPRRLPILDAVRVVEPCDVGWDALTGAGPHRRCDACHRDVWDLASLHHDGVVGLLAVHGGTLCARVRHSPGAPPRATPRRAAMMLGGALALTPALAAAQDAGAAPAVTACPPTLTAPSPVAPASAPPTDPAARPPLAELVSLGVVRMRLAVEFLPRGVAVTPRGLRVLEATLATLRALPDLRRVRVEGHRSRRGDGLRRDLGLRRAAWVRDWFTARGVDPARLVLVDRGSDHPIAPAGSAALNRRVEFHVDDEAGPSP